MDETTSELFKLDPVDRKTLFWMMDNDPLAIRSWIDYIGLQYRAQKSVEINSDKLYAEVKEELNG